MHVAFAHNKNIKENVQNYNTSEINVKTRLKVNIQKSTSSFINVSFACN